jgi:hypothetical protein
MRRKSLSGRCGVRRTSRPPRRIAGREMFSLPASPWVFALKVVYYLGMEHV